MYIHTYIILCILAYSLLPLITICSLHFCSRAGFIDCGYFFHIFFLLLSYSFESIRINSIAICYLLFVMYAITATRRRREAKREKYQFFNFKKKKKKNQYNHQHEFKLVLITILQSYLLGSMIAFSHYL